MATVKTLVAGLGDTELAGCVSEAIAWQDGRKLAGDLLRNCAKRLVDELRIDDESALQIAEVHVLREAAIRFVRQVPGQ